MEGKDGSLEQGSDIKLIVKRSESALDCQSRSLSQTTLDFYRKKLAHFRRFLVANNVASPQDITPQLVRCYIVSLQSIHGKGGQHCYFRAMRTIVRYWHAEGEIEKNIFANIQAPDSPMRSEQESVRRAKP